MVKPDYAGDVTVVEAWSVMNSEPKAQLIDVRTTAEWSFVGLPDLSSLGRPVHCVEWQSYPQMGVNQGFVEATRQKLQAAGADAATPLFFLCRSGARSRAAAIAMTQAGFSKAFNVAGGFEGDLDQARHRGTQNGWKAAGLPWRQS
ncbi:MAG TPA: rhodanese-like domain-containing protein [Rhizomicrobium sp.]|nr:rhodanese-like domain-containing protein [Rhizomicrobium sp.]